MSVFLRLLPIILLFVASIESTIHNEEPQGFAPRRFSPRLGRMYGFGGAGAMSQAQSMSMAGGGGGYYPGGYNPYGGYGGYGGAGSMAMSQSQSQASAMGGGMGIYGRR